jgi:acetylornithine deacetylase
MSVPQAAATTADLEKTLDALWPTYEQGLQDLIRIPSLIGEEARAQEQVAVMAEGAGLAVEVWDVDPAELAKHPDYAPVDGGEGVRPNVTGVLSGTGGGAPSIAISGHIDVVSPNPTNQWKHGPWSGAVEDGRMYGRGTLDMKSGLVAGLLAIDAVQRTYGPLAGDVVFESVIEEECTGNGTLAARLHGPRVGAALIPEVSGEDVQIANPGVVWFEVTVTGKPAYVGLAGASVNAVEVAMDVVVGLRALVDRLNESFEHPAYNGQTRPLTLNVGTFEGGDWPSNVPLECRVGFRLSFPVDWSVAQAQRAIEQRLDEIAAEHSWLKHHPPRLRFHGFRAHGFYIDPADPIVELLKAKVSDVTGKPARISAMFGTADARYFADHGIPAVYYGPAGGNMHAPDEWVELDSVRRVASVLARTVVSWAGPASPGTGT